MNLISIQLNAILDSMIVQLTIKPRRILSSKSSNGQHIDYDRPDRERPGRERDFGDYGNRFDEPESRPDPEYPWQDFNYGP